MLQNAVDELTDNCERSVEIELCGNVLKFSNNGNVFTEDGIISMTKISMPFPVLIHAALDLDSHRNQLNETTQNKMVLASICKLMVEIAQSNFDNIESPERFGISENELPQFAE